MQWSQIHPENGSYNIQITQVKTKDPVRIFLAGQALFYLGNLKLNDPGKVFILRDHRHTQRHLKLSLESVKGIKANITFHSARHTFATLTLTYGAVLKTVSELLGHRSIKVTERYAKIVDKLKEEAVKKLPRI